MPGTVNVSFDDVWGQDEAKQKVKEQVALLEDSEHIEAAGGYMPKGLLLYGPPGTGKTYLAKAAANYSSKPLILVPPGAFQATFVGINLLKVWTLFREIRKLARRYGGVIVFIDEIDSLGSRGGSVENEAHPAECRAPGCVPFSRPAEGHEPRRIVVDGAGGMGTLEAFLSAMDGMEEPRGFLNRMIVFLGFKPLAPYEYKYLMMGATNMMERLDPALLRAGRFGRKIHVTYPKVDGRQRTYEGYLSRVTNDLTPENVEWASRNHARGTGAEIQDIVNEALLVSFRDDRADPGVVRFPDLVHAMVWTKFGEGEGQFERETARWQVAVHEAGHAVAFHLLSAHRQAIWFASIEQRGATGGMVVPTPLQEDWLLTRDELLADIQVALASRVAEEMILGTTTNGHGGDGQSATMDAVKMVNYGQAGNIGAWPADGREIRRQAEGVLAEALAACRGLLAMHKADIEAVAKLLVDNGTVTGDEIASVLA
jgi:ATP-dependent Zn protease